MFHNYVTFTKHNFNDLEVEMNIEAKRAYLKAVKERYNQSSKKEKTQILTEFCLNCNYSRKHAIKLLNSPEFGSNVIPFKRRPGAPQRYSSRVDKRLADEDIKRQLLTMSESTIERRLRPTKRKRPKGKSTTTPPKTKTQIPLKLCKDDDRKTLGYFEADTVAHCGDSLAGKFAWTLTMTDLHSGWTENRACHTKNSEGVRERVKEVELSLPFPVIGFSSDNGSEFLNSTLYEFLVESRTDEIEFTRGRPYRKNDNAHVEQKNYTHARQLFGYERIEEKELVEMMNEIYSDLWCPLKNFYSPCLKLKKKVRIGAKIKKQYDLPKTPYQRVLESGQLTLHQRKKLEQRKSKLNPFKLKNQLDQRLKEFYDLLEKYRQETKTAA